MGTPVTEALAKLRTATSKDEGDDVLDGLAKIARQHLPAIAELFYGSEGNAFALVWCLQGIKEPMTRSLFQDALKHKDALVRWAAAEGLKHWDDRALVPTFISALKDRSHLVKGVAVEWLSAYGDANAIAPLKRLLALPGFRRNSPGTILKIEEALPRLKSRKPARALRVRRPVVDGFRVDGYIVWARSKATGNLFPIFIFQADVDYVTEGLISLTSLNGNEVVLTKMTAEEWNGYDQNRTAERVNKAMKRTDLRAVALLLPTQPGQYDLSDPPLLWTDIYQASGVAESAHRQSINVFTRQGRKILVHETRR